MNIFFYTIQETTQSSAVLNWLTSLYPPLHIQVLSSNLGLSSPESRNLRNGDLLIIFIRDQNELKTLINAELEYSNYKIYLIFQDDDPELIKAGLLLSPKHYSSIEKKYIHAEETIRKIVKKNQ